MNLKIQSLFCFAFLLLWSSCQTNNEVADIILQNGNIYTVDTQMPEAQAVAIKDGLIFKVGSNEEISSLADGNTCLLYTSPSPRD